MLDALKFDVVGILSKVQIRAEEDVAAVDEQRRKVEELPMDFQHKSAPGREQDKAMTRVGRNEPCPCGSGKKYKQCHGKLA